MIVLIDNYDSFTYNLYQYLGEFDPEIRVIRNDAITAEEVMALQPDQVVISPGPKTPDDAGNCLEIIKHVAGKIPILGVCLGHQSIGQAFGGEVVHAKTLFHGKQSKITLQEDPLFEGMNKTVNVARYHSLVVKAETLPLCFEVLAKTDEGEIMAMKHKTLPVYGLQFHPESILTEDGKTLLKNFLAMGQ